MVKVRPGRTSNSARTLLRRGVSVRAAEDVRIAEGRGAVLLGCRRGRYGSAARYRQLRIGAPAVDRRTNRSVADIVPYARSIPARRNGVYVVAEELEPQIVLAGSSRIARCAPVQL